MRGMCASVCEYGDTKGNVATHRAQRNGRQRYQTRQGREFEYFKIQKGGVNLYKMQSI